MAKDLSKYVFDVDNPKGFKVYGLLKKIFKEQNILLVIDLFFFNEIFKDIIWTEDVIEEIWDKPDNFRELSSNEKMEIYIDRFSSAEYGDILQKKQTAIFKSSFLKSIKSYATGAEDIGIQNNFPDDDLTPYYEFDLITTEKIDINILSNNFDIISDICFLRWNLKKSSSTGKYGFIRINEKNKNNILFLTSKELNLKTLQSFNPNKSSTVIIPYAQKEFIEKNYNLPQNTHPIILKKPEHIHQLLNLVLHDSKINKFAKNAPKAYLKKVQIKNYYTIENITLNKISTKKEIYLLGENGDGKTLLLQAILMAAKWHQISHSDLEITGIIHQQAKENPTLELYSEDTSQQKYQYPIAEKSLQNIFAYGVNRQENSANTDEYGYMTLFKKDKYLQEPIKWLQYLYNKELEGTNDSISLEIAKNLLNSLLEEKVTISVNVDEVRFTERGSENVKFEQLSDGYKSILIWVCDLVSRLSRNQPYITDLKDFHGVVLVDEVGLHLHPKWEANLVQKLRTWFKNIQFIFTTHSPIIILNASKDAVVYRLYKEEGITKISDQYQCSELSNLMLNGLITSPLFDLERATMRIYQADKDDLDTSEDYRLGRLRKLVDKEYQALKASKKTFISPSMIDDIIAKVMNEN